MAKRSLRVASSMLVVHLCLAGGCSTLRSTMDGLVRRGAAIEEVHRSRTDYRTDLHEQRVAQKLAEIDDKLRNLNQTNCTKTETTLAMEMSQSLEIQDITIDVEELKNVIARAEARARAEELRQERLPGLLREQQAFGRNGFRGGDQRQRLDQVAFDGSVVQAADEADIVVGIDQHGDPLPFCAAAKPTIGPSEIPYLVRMRINVGLENPRLEKSKVRRHPGCGLPDCYGKGCSKCAAVVPQDQPLYAAAEPFQNRVPQAGNYMRVAEDWLNEPSGDSTRSSQATSPTTNSGRVATRSFPPPARAVNWPTFDSSGGNGPPERLPPVTR